MKSNTCAEIPTVSGFNLECVYKPAGHVGGDFFQIIPILSGGLLTDGVVEARARTGELLGFERTATLSTHPAESIAQTAQDFGQEDDITVLTLSRAL